MKVSGPVSFYEFVYQGTKYLFFGDIHFGTENDCPDELNIQDLLKQFFSSTQGPIDFFFESFYLPKGKKRLPVQPIDYSGQVYQTFLNCFQHDKKKCMYPHVRFHAIDIRSVDTHSVEPFFILFELVKDMVEFYQQNMDQPYLPTIQKVFGLTLHIVLDPIEKYVDYYQSINYPEQIDLWRREIISSLQKISPEIDELLNEPPIEIEKFLSAFRVQLLKKRNSLSLHPSKVQVQKSDEPIEEFIHTKVHEHLHLLKQALDQNDIEEIAIQLLQLSSLVVDMYVLGRMFAYNTNTVVVYAGQSHIEHYVEFFQNVLGVSPIVEVPQTDKNRCIDLGADNFIF